MDTDKLTCLYGGQLRIDGGWTVDEQWIDRRKDSGWTVEGQWMNSGRTVDGQWMDSIQSLDGYFQEYAWIESQQAKLFRPWSTR